MRFIKLNATRFHNMSVSIKYLTKKGEPKLLSGKKNNLDAIFNGRQYVIQISF